MKTIPSKLNEPLKFPYCYTVEELERENDISLFSSRYNLIKKPKLNKKLTRVISVISPKVKNEIWEHYLKNGFKTSYYSEKYNISYSSMDVFLRTKIDER